MPAGRCQSCLAYNGHRLGCPQDAPATDYAKLYEELRQAIDGGSESMTHKDALEAVKYWQEQPAQPLTIKLTVKHLGDIYD